MNHIYFTYISLWEGFFIVTLIDVGAPFWLVGAVAVGVFLLGALLFNNYESQEKVIGRSKPDSVELDPRPADSHVGRTDQDVFGKVFRRNTPYGTVTEHGTMFVGFGSDQQPLRAMLESMAGVKDGVRDALTRFTRPLTGAYYFIPSIEAIRAFATAPD